VWFREGTLPVPAVRVNQRAVLVSPAGPAVWSYGLRAGVSWYGQEADVGRQGARLARRAAGPDGPVMRVEAAVGSGKPGPA
jgi:putative resolvase